MGYSVKEIYLTLQGEGFHTGRVAVFCRFAGCNLWSGREEERAAAKCGFCDTDFVGTDGPGGGKFSSAGELAASIAEKWSPASNNAGRFVVCSGGEPLLQLDRELIEALHDEGFEVAVETNGTCAAPDEIDWICVSPKAGVDLELKSGNELKLIYPQPGIEPSELENLKFEHFYLQPMDGPNRELNTRLAVEFCLQHPRWRLSLQTHKYLGIA